MAIILSSIINIRNVSDLESEKSFRTRTKMAKNQIRLIGNNAFFKISLKGNALFLSRLDIICIDALASSIYKT